MSAKHADDSIGVEVKNMTPPQIMTHMLASLVNKDASLIRRGLRLFEAALQQEPSTFLRLYVQQSARMKEIRDVMDGPAQDFETLDALFSLLDSLCRCCREAKEDLLDVVPRLGSLFHHLVSRRLRLLYRLMTAEDHRMHHRVVKSLTMLSTFDSATARLLFEQLDFSYKPFIRMCSRAGEFRVGIAKFVFGWLSVAESDVVMGILRVKGLLSSTLKRLVELDVSLVEYILSSLSTLVLQRSSIPLINRLSFLSSFVLDQLLVMYESDALSMIGHAFMVDCIAGLLLAGDTASPQEASQLEATSVRLLCRLNASTDLRQRSLLHHFVTRKPVLAVRFMQRSDMSFEPRPSIRWLGNVTCVNSVPDSTIIEGVACLAQKQRRSIMSYGIVGFLIPASLSRAHLTKGMQHSNALVRSTTLTLVATILRRFIAVVKRCQGHPVTDELATARSSLRSLLPEISSLLRLRPVGDYGPREEYVFCQMLRVLSQYQAALPGCVAESRFNLWKLLDAYSCWSDATLCALTRIVLSCSPTDVNLWNVNADGTVFGQLLRFVEHWRGRSAFRLYASTRRFTRDVLVRCGLFGDNTDEIDVWLDSLTTSRTSILDWLVQEARKRPAVEECTGISNLCQIGLKIMDLGPSGTNDYVSEILISVMHVTPHLPLVVEALRSGGSIQLAKLGASLLHQQRTRSFPSTAAPAIVLGDRFRERVLSYSHGSIFAQASVSHKRAVSRALSQNPRILFSHAFVLQPFADGDVLSDVVDAISDAKCTQSTHFIWPLLSRMEVLQQNPSGDVRCAVSFGVACTIARLSAPKADMEDCLIDSLHNLLKRKSMSRSQRWCFAVLLFAFCVVRACSPAFSKLDSVLVGLSGKGIASVDACLGVVIPVLGCSAIRMLLQNTVPAPVTRSLVRRLITEDWNGQLAYATLSTGLRRLLSAADISDLIEAIRHVSDGTPRWFLPDIVEGSVLEKLMGCSAFDTVRILVLRSVSLARKVQSMIVLQQTSNAELLRLAAACLTQLAADQSPQLFDWIKRRQDSVLLLLRQHPRSAAQLLSFVQSQWDAPFRTKLMNSLLSLPLSSEDHVGSVCSLFGALAQLKDNHAAALSWATSNVEWLCQLQNTAPIAELISCCLQSRPFSNENDLQRLLRFLVSSANRTESYLSTKGGTICHALLLMFVAGQSSEGRAFCARHAWLSESSHKAPLALAVHCSTALKDIFASECFIQNLVVSQCVAVAQLLHTLLCISGPRLCDANIVQNFVSMYSATTGIFDACVKETLQVLQEWNLFSFGSRWRFTTEGTRPLFPHRLVVNGAVANSYDPEFVFPFLHRALKTQLRSVSDLIKLGCIQYCNLHMASENSTVRSQAYACASQITDELDAVSPLAFKAAPQLQNLLLTLRNSIESLNQKLPMLWAVFLALAVDTVCKPDHFMYKAVNKFLLQRPSLDLSDVPMFYVLFNSASEAQRSQRKWLLRVVSEGVVSHQDVLLLRRRHVVELCMSLYGSRMSDPETNAILEHILYTCCHAAPVESRSVVTFAATALHETVLNSHGNVDLQRACALLRLVTSSAATRSMSCTVSFEAAARLLEYCLHASVKPGWEVCQLCFQLLKFIDADSQVLLFCFLCRVWIKWRSFEVGVLLMQNLPEAPVSQISSHTIGPWCTAAVAACAANLAAPRDDQAAFGIWFQKVWASASSHGLARPLLASCASKVLMGLDSCNNPRSESVKLQLMNLHQESQLSFVQQ